MTTELLTEEEKFIIDHLSSAWNLFISLEEQREWENVEFMHAIHLAQIIVLSRPTTRYLNTKDVE